MRIKKTILIAFLATNFLNAQSISLSEAYEMAIENNSNLKKNMYETLAANQRVKQSTAMLMPNLRFQASYNLDKYKRKYPKSTRREDESFYRYGIELSQSIFNYSLWQEREQSTLRFEGSSIMEESVKQELAKEVTKAYFDYAYAKEALRLALVYEDSSKAKYNQMQKSLELGLVDKINMLESRVRYDEAILEVSKAKRQIDITKLVLFNLIGQEVDVKNSFSNLNLNFFKSLPLNVFEDVHKNLSYKQSLLAIEISQKEYEKRKSEVLPTVNLNANYSNQQYRDERFEDKDNRVEVMLRFSMPIFTSGLISSKIEEARLLNLATIQRDTDVQKSIAVTQKQAISDFLSYIDDYEILNKSLEHANIYELSIQKGYDEGLRDIVDLLDAKFRVFKVNNELLSTGYKIVIAYVDLQNLIGNISINTIRELDKIFK